MNGVLSILASIVVALFLVTASAEATTMATGGGDGCASAPAMSMSSCDACATGDVDDSFTCDINCTIPAQGVIADAGQPIAPGRMQHSAAPSVRLTGAPTPPEPHPPRPPFLS